ncbi:twin-arginine translocase TatA/TatE family subunit [Camelliibacillus cellulosilyticus]|uniref:Sec-independent protein translocase protein TatA n=1 Tax=Camelliibacillus cellulosilyticus TaxID=2174486 RepID=A0ABV9GQ96_9BACL
MLGWGEILLIVIVGLFIFGPSKLPQMGKAAGQTLRAFKEALNEDADFEKHNAEDDGRR